MSGNVRIQSSFVGFEASTLVRCPSFGRPCWIKCIWDAGSVEGSAGQGEIVFYHSLNRSRVMQAGTICFFFTALKSSRRA